MSIKNSAFRRKQQYLYFYMNNYYVIECLNMCFLRQTFCDFGAILQNSSDAKVDIYYCFWCNSIVLINTISQEFNAGRVDIFKICTEVDLIKPFSRYSQPIRSYMLGVNFLHFKLTTDDVLMRSCMSSYLFQFNKADNLKECIMGRSVKLNTSSAIKLIQGCSCQI